MYENVTFDLILQRMLDRVPNTVDKREGSIIYDALAPAAVELQEMYIQLDVILNETFADTATREYLIKRAAERGITPKAATKAILEGVFNIAVPIESRFSHDDLNYIVTELIAGFTYKLECETAGADANVVFGDLIPIDYINGLTSAELTELLIPGEDETSTEALRQEYFDSLESQAFGGNITDYKTKVDAINGVGGVKVYPVWAGGGTVKLVIIDSDYNAPSGALVDSVQSLVDPVTNSGEGVGFAPIGHVVTVFGVTTESLDIATTITYESGYVWADVEPYVQAAIDAYFLELKESWDSVDNIIVRISQIETRLLDVVGILDIADTSINGVQANFTVNADKIPLRGVVSG